MRRAENASPVQAAEEPPNLKNPNQRRRKLSPYCLGFGRFRFQKMGSYSIGCVWKKKIKNFLL